MELWGVGCFHQHNGVVFVEVWVVHLGDAIVAPGGLTQSHGHRQVSDAKRAEEGVGEGSQEGGDVHHELSNRRENGGKWFMVA